MGSKKVIINTVITQIATEGVVRPKSPFFAIYNDGDSEMYINRMYIAPGETFVLEADMIIATAMARGIEVENKTQLNIQFFSAVRHVRRVSAQLIETFIKEN